MIQIKFTFFVSLLIVIIIIITFILLAYKTFTQRIIKEKHSQYLLEIQHQKKMLELGLKVQENERKRIASLLHDDVGSKLNILSVWFNNPANWNNKRSKDIISKQIPEIIETTRSISHNLYPSNLERFGLLDTIDEMIANIESSLSVKIILLNKYSPFELSKEVQIYRIIQEFLSNVIKHAKATELLIHIKDSDLLLNIILSDNGKGFDLKNVNKGMGLENIAFRIESLNASHKWKSKINEGCKLIISIPKNDK